MTRHQRVLRDRLKTKLGDEIRSESRKDYRIRDYIFVVQTNKSIKISAMNYITYFLGFSLPTLYEMNEIN